LREQRARERQIRGKGDDREAAAVQTLRLRGLCVRARRSEDQQQQNEASD
jgi:hypothetical protein